MATSSDLEKNSGEGYSLTGYVTYMGRQCVLTLKQDSIHIQVDNSSSSIPINSLMNILNHEFSVPLEDVFGLYVDRLPISSLIYTCRAELCTYERLKSTSPKAPPSNCRKLVKRDLFFDGHGDFGDNCAKAEEWRDAIQYKRLERCKEIFTSTPEQINRSIEPHRLLVIINPFSGKKASLKLYHNVARPLFHTAGCVIVQELVTERQGHARDFIRKFDLSTINGVVMVSGDGILYEVINGLMERPDWERAIKTPLGLLPTGSGNALVSSQLYETNEKGSDALVSAIFQIVNSGIQSHDMASVYTPSSLVYMGVAINWGITGIVDIESERFRFLGGELRFLLGALWCIARKKSYRGILSYLPIENEVIEGDDENKSTNRPVQGNDEYSDLTSRPLNTDDHPTINNTHSSLNAIPTDESPQVIGESALLNNSVCPIPSIKLTDPIPSNWKTIEGNFIVCMGIMCSHMSDTGPGHLNKRTDSGDIWIIYTTENVTRKELLNAMSEAYGDHTLLENFHAIRTTQFRLTPLSDGIISIDGEKVEYSPLQVHVHPGMIRLFSRKRT